MWRWQTSVGMAIGLVLGLVILSLTGGGWSRRAPVGSGPILSECDGRLEELVMHYEPSAKPAVATVYREFLGALDADVTVHVLCPSQAAFDDFAALVGKPRCRLNPVIVNHPMTTWSRDRWVAFAPAAPGRPTTLWSPRGEAAEEIWPARAGDERVGFDLAVALGMPVRARRSSLYFDGGDFLADGDSVLVVPRVLQRNIQHTVRTREEFLSLLGLEFKKRVILLEEAPDHHVGMFMASVGNRTMLVSDPALGRKLAVAPSADPDGALPAVFNDLPGGADFTPETQRLFDAVAAQSAAEGYRVIRIPVVPARDGRTYLTYCNALLDQREGQRIAYLPVYRGVEKLNAAARTVWEDLGYQVRPVDCTSVYRHFGCLHCLVNVLRRS